MSAHCNLSCNDLKFRWKIEPIRKEEEKLRVLIKGEESALQRLLVQRETSAPCNGAPPKPYAFVAKNDTNDGKSQKVEDNRQETVLRLRCERRRKKLNELHAQKLEILWDFVKEWLKLEVDRLSVEKVLKKNPSMKSLTKYYIRYPRDILGEEESWQRVERIMALNRVEFESQDEIFLPESEDIGDENDEHSGSQLEVMTYSNIARSAIEHQQMGVGIIETESVPIQESASRYAEDSYSPDMQGLLGENYLNKVTNTSCPWQRGSEAHADWEYAKTLQLEASNLESNVRNTNKAFLDESPENSKRSHTNDEVKGQTSSSKNIVKGPENHKNSNNLRRDNEATLKKPPKNVTSSMQSNTTSRRGRGGYVKQQQKISKNHGSAASRDDSSLPSSAAFQARGKCVKTYAKVLAEPRRNATILPTKNRKESLPKTNSAQKDPAKGDKTSVHNRPAGSTDKPKAVGTHRLAKSGSAKKPVVSSDVVHSKVYKASNSPVKSDKASKLNSTTKPDTRQNRRSCDAKPESEKAKKPAKNAVVTSKEPLQQTRASCESAFDPGSSLPCKKAPAESTTSQSPNSNEIEITETLASIPSSETMEMVSTVKARKDASTSPMHTEEPRIVFIGIDEGDEICISAEQSEELPETIAPLSSKTDNENRPCQQHSKSEITEVTLSPSTGLNVYAPAVAIERNVDQDSVNLDIVVPPLDLSGLSNNSENDTLPEPKTVSFVGDTYNNSILIEDIFEPHDVTDHVGVTRDTTPTEAQGTSVFDFFFRGHSTGSNLPEGFPRFDTPRNKKEEPNYPPSHCPTTAGDFKPFQNSWLGGLPGTNIPTLSPGRIDPHIWSNSYNPQSTSDGWNHNEEASNHLKRMLRINTTETPSENRLHKKYFGDTSAEAKENTPAQKYSQFLNNIGENDIKDRGDPYGMQCKDNTSHLHDPCAMSGDSSYCVTNSTSLALPEALPQRIRKSDSEEDFGSFFPSSSIFDSSFGI